MTAAIVAALMGSSVVAANPLIAEGAKLVGGALLGVAADRAIPKKEDKEGKGSTTYVDNKGGNMTNYAKGEGSTAVIGANNPQEGDTTLIENNGNMTNMAEDRGTSVIGVNRP